MWLQYEHLFPKLDLLHSLKSNSAFSRLLTSTLMIKTAYKKLKTKENTSHYRLQVTNLLLTDVSIT